jgi:hypothetical protein
MEKAGGKRLCTAGRKGGSLRCASCSRPRFGSHAQYAIYDAHLQFATAVEVGHYPQRVGAVDSLAAVFED